LPLLFAAFAAATV